MNDDNMKRISQELECQRHNTASSQQHAEQKIKEKEQSYNQEMSRLQKENQELIKSTNDLSLKLQQLQNKVLVTYF